MGLFKKFVSQTRKPVGFLGKVMLSGMNSGHAAMADWGFSHLTPITPEKAVDLGCGGGRNAGELLKKYPKAHVTAIDYSELSVEKAKALNQAAIAAGRCEVRQGDLLQIQVRRYAGLCEETQRYGLQAGEADRHDGRQVHEEVRSRLDGAERLRAADRQKVNII